MTQSKRIVKAPQAKQAVRKGQVKTAVKAVVRPVVKKIIKAENIQVLKTEAAKENKIKKGVGRDFWNGLLVVAAGILALIIFLSFFFRFLISFALYKDMNSISEELSLQSNNLSIESDKIEASVEESLQNNNTLASDSSVEEMAPGQVSVSEFMELPNAETSLADLNFLNSPDGSKFAYVIKNEVGLSAIMLNGEESSYYDEITFMSFSPDSQHFAFGVRIGSQEAVVLDGKQGKAYDWVFLPRFYTTDSKYFVYKTRTAEGDMLVFNEEEGPVYEQIYNPFVSEDESQLIYYARKGNKIFKNTLGLEK